MSESVVDKLITALLEEEGTYTALVRAGLTGKINAICEVARAYEAIVAKLPKTADGVPIVPGMKVYQTDPTGYVQGYDVGVNQAADDSSWPSPAYLTYSQCYSTREAAEAAAEAAAAQQRVLEDTLDKLVRIVRET